jgi:glycosyltransferase involved in cell wall biosynthesis
MHRARILAWHLRQYGWDLEILCPSNSIQEAKWIDPNADGLFAPNVIIHRAPPLKRAKLLRTMGIRGLSWQSLLPIYQAGSELLRRHHFDLVLFSTTAFNLFCLGRLWQRRFGVPYILDFQDPWFRDRPAASQTTKHVWKSRIGNLLASLMERFAVEKAKGLLSVSPHYLATLKQRYPNAIAFADGGHAETIPFGGREPDYPAPMQRAHPPFIIAYVGAGGALMEKSFSYLMRLFAALSKVEPNLVRQFQIRLVGTDSGWTDGQPKYLKNLADALGLADLVTEDPTLVPYSKATRIAADADGLLVLGVDEPAYMASKLFSYASLQKPLLACIGCRSQMNDYFSRYPDLGNLLHFDEGEGSDPHNEALLHDFLIKVMNNHRSPRVELLAAHSGEAMTQKLVKFLDACVGAQSPAET